MKQGKSILDNLPKPKYFDLLPNVEEQKKQAFTMLILTLIALSVFGLFAINPTLSTIANLQKQLSDNKDLDRSLDTKITNLGILQQKYDALQNDLPVIFRAIPQTPTAPSLAGQLQAIAQSTNVTLSGLQTSAVDLVTTTIDPQQKPIYTFSVTVTGTNQNITHFLQSLTDFDRIITFDKFTISQESTSTTTNTLNLAISGKAYFKQSNTL